MSVIKLLVLVVFSFAISQSNPAIRFRQISIEDGLSQTSILDMIQDRQGFMWFATQDGLNKYDGYNFTYFKYDPYQHNTISSNWVTAIFEDSQGEIWTISDAINLNRYQPVSNKIQRFRFFSSDSINRVITPRLFREDKSGAIWVTNAAGFFRFNRQNGKFEQIVSDSTLFPKNRINGIVLSFFDSQNRIWIATEDNRTVLMNLKNNQLQPIEKTQLSELLAKTKSEEIYEDSWKNIWILSNHHLIRIKPDLSDIKLYPLRYPNLIRLSYNEETNTNKRFIEDKYHDIWFLTDGALGRFDPESESISYYQFKKIINGDSRLQINGLFEDSNGLLWLTSDESGLLRFDRESASFSIYKHQPANRNSISDDVVTRIFEDDNGTIWVGTSAAGVNYFNPNKAKFENFQFSDGELITNNFVWALAQNESNHVWIGTNGFGLIDYATDSHKIEKHYTVETNGFASNRIKAILIDRDGILWLGTMGDGLMSFNPNTGKMKSFRSKENNPNTLANNFINSIIEDHNGYLWIATSYGLNRFDKKNQFITYRGSFADENSLSNTSTRSLYQDENGHIWVGTMYGLYELNPLTDKFTRYLSILEDSTTISQNMVLSLSGDKNGHIFIGTFGGGLNILDLQSKRINLITSRSGLSNDVIYGILYHQPDLWLSTNQGLSNFNIETQVIRNYDLNDGLQNYEFNGGAAAESSDGKFLFGGISGFNRFDPKAISESKNESPLVLTAFKVLGKSIQFENAITYTNEIELNYDDSYFSFEFAALDFVNSRKNRYLYKLEGFDPDWLTVKRNFATYTNIDPGEYTFIVKSMNNDLVVNTNELRIRLVIHPPFWQTPWFIISSTIVIIALLIVLYKRELRKKIDRLREIEEIRAIENERIRRKTADDFHDEMGNKLTRIRVLCDLILRKLSANSSQEVVTLLQSISENSQNLYNGTRDFIWSIDPNNDSFYELAIRMKDFADEFFDNTGIDFHVRGISKILDNVQLTLDKRRQILLIFKEAMTNILKHSKAKNVTLEFRQRKGHFAVSLTDDGSGFDTNITEGQGLRSIQSRAKKIDGNLTINSNSNGTKIVFTDSSITAALLYENSIERDINE